MCPVRVVCLEDGTKQVICSVPEASEGVGAGELDAVDWKAVLQALAPLLIALLQKLAV